MFRDSEARRPAAKAVVYGVKHHVIALFRAPRPCACDGIPRPQLSPERNESIQVGQENYQAPLPPWINIRGQSLSRHAATTSRLLFVVAARNRLGPADRRHATAAAGDLVATKRRVTIREVANLAQVSLGTVSNVLNNPSVVAPVTRKRVLDAIDSTRFVRNTAARQLRVGKSRTIGVVLLDIANPFFTEIVRGAERVLREQDYVLMLCSSDESAKREQRYLRMLEEHRVDAILVCPVGSDLKSASALVSSGIPTVLLDRDGSSCGLCSVAVDDIRGAELAADHLLELGHKAIVLVNGPATIRQCIDRKEGARRSVWRARAAGLAARDRCRRPHHRPR